MSDKPYKLSLLSAILININIMLGSGIFINTVILARTAGALGTAVYGIVALLILPLIVVMANLLRYFPNGTLYDFGKSINPFVGFLSSWGYFTAKLATSALGIHVFITLMQQLVPQFACINPLFLDIAILAFFLYLNTLNMRIGRSIQYAFIFLKFIPISFVLFAALFWFSGVMYSADQFIWSGIPACIPFVLFAFSGFEASASLSKNIEDSEKNAPRAIIISYLIVLSVVMLFQFGFFGILGTTLARLPSFKEAFPLLAQIMFSNNIPLEHIANIVTAAGIASSTLGASYGIIYSNIWNLHSLAHNNHVFGKKIFTHLNIHNVPIYCVLAEGLFVIGYLLYAQGNQVPLQQISACGATLAYTISAWACLRAVQQKSFFEKFFAWASLASCGLLIIATINNAYSFGFHPYYLFGTILVSGITMFFITKQSNT